MMPEQIDFSSVRENAEAESTVQAGVPNGFRRLKWNEPVTPGDFLMDEQRGFEPWKGPAGFRAGSFVNPIYRRE